MMMTTAVMCMALNVYHESRGDTFVGQHAVAQVTFNRAGRDPNQVCKEVFKPKQFSWANELTAAAPESKKVVAQKLVPREKKAWALATQIASVTVNGQVADFTNGAMAFHAKGVSPWWGKHFKYVGMYGQHKFYTHY